MEQFTNQLAPQQQQQQVTDTREQQVELTEDNIGSTLAEEEHPHTKFRPREPRHRRKKAEISTGAIATVKRTIESYAGYMASSGMWGILFGIMAFIFFGVYGLGAFFVFSVVSFGVRKYRDRSNLLPLYTPAIRALQQLNLGAPSSITEGGQSGTTQQSNNSSVEKKNEDIVLDSIVTVPSTNNSFQSTPEYQPPNIALEE